MVQPYVALDRLWHCLSVLSWFFLMLHMIDCDIVYMFSPDSSSCCIWLIVILFICVLMVLPHVALYWLWHCLSVFLWFFLMLHWIDCDINYLCSYGSSSRCIGLIVTLFVFVLMVLPHVALDSLLHCFSLFLWFFLILHWIDYDFVFLCSYVSTSCCIELIVVLFTCVLMVLPHVALDWLWHCLSVFLWFFLMFALDWFQYCLPVFSWFFLMLPWIDCDIVFFCVFKVFRHVSFDLLWHCLSLFSWFFLMLHWIDCDIVYLCSYGSFLCCLCCIGLILTVFFCVLMGLPYVALDWLWHCLSVFSWFFLMLPWINCGIVYLCSHGSVSCCIGLIVTLFVCVLMVLPHVPLDWLWHCLSEFSSLILMLPWIGCGIVCLCSHGSSSCSLWFWHCLSEFSSLILMLPWIDCGIVYLCFHDCSSCCLRLIVTLFICVFMTLPHVALD